MKKCAGCQVERSFSDFWKKSGTPDGLDSRCKICRNVSRNSDPRTKIRKRRALLKHKYGISLEDYEAMLEKQGGVCAACGDVETRKDTQHLAVDHDHSTGVVRGILCQKCNTALGLLNDDPQRISALLNYLITPPLRRTR